MKAPTKILLGFLAILPLVIFVVWGGMVYYWFTTDPQPLLDLVLNHPVPVSLFNLGLFIGSFGPVGFFLIHAARNPDLGDRRIAWILLIVLLGGLAMPIYWYMFIWHDSYYEP